MKYYIKLMDRQQITISEDEAGVLKQAVLSGDAPKYIEIGNTVFATNQIIMIYPDDTIYPNLTPKLKEAPMTPEQLAQRQETLAKMRKSLNL